MPNGSDRAVLLQHLDACLPTHLVVVNLDERLHHPLEEMAAFLPHFGVTLVHVHDHEDATVRVESINEAQMLRMLPDLAAFDVDDPSPWARALYRYHRPAILHALRTAFKTWADETRQDRTVLVFVGSPRTPRDAVMLGELPLDVEAMFFRRTGTLPLVLRFMIAPRSPRVGDADDAVGRLLADLEQTYFELPDYPQPFERHTSIDSPSASPYDTTIWVDGTDGDDVVQLLRTIVRLHGEENARFAGNRPPPSGSEPSPSLDDAIAVEAGRRTINWLSLCRTDRTPRLWLDGLEELATVLDRGSGQRRASGPLSPVRAVERERDWRENSTARPFLDGVERPRALYDDVPRSDFPYRITEDDRPSMLELARQLADVGEFDRAAQVATELLADDPEHRLLNRMLGANLYVAGHHERGGAILRHCIALTEADASLAEAERADEIATLHHLLKDYDAAISGYERALEADPFNTHAYQGLVLILRARGERALADHWLQAAKRRNLDLPLIADDEQGPLEDAFAARADSPPSGRGETGRLRDRRSRWWSFLRRS